MALPSGHSALRRDRDGRIFAAGLEITPQPGTDEEFFDWLLVQRVGGRADGVWFTASLTRSEFEQRGESEGEGEGKEEE